MIGISGQYLISFSIGNLKDFLDESDLLDFSIIEECGNLLPTFEISFISRSDEIKSLLNESYPLVVQFGKDLNSLQNIQLFVLKYNHIEDGNSKTRYYVAGTAFSVSYNSKDNISIYEKKSGVEVLNTVVSKYFKPDFNITKSIDSQVWIQHNITDRKFVHDLWLHSDVGDSFLACGIGINKKFILRDIKKLLKSKYSWRFTNLPEQANDISFDPGIMFDYSPGITNAAVGYGRKRLIHNMESGSESFVSPTIAPFIAMSSKLARRADIESRYGSLGIVNDNCHPNYHKAYLQNTSNLLSFSNLRLPLTFSNKYVPINLLDLVMVKLNMSIADDGNSEYTSGLYIVTKIGRTISNRQMTTVVELNRESFNSIKGSSR